MEQRAACLVLMLCLVFGMLVKQSTAKAKMDMNECYNLCTKVCFGSSLGSDEGSLACPSCYSYCYNYVHGKTCFLAWCWKIRWCIWNLGAWEIENTLCRQPMQAKRNCEHQRRIISYDVITTQIKSNCYLKKKNLVTFWTATSWFSQLS